MPPLAIGAAIAGIGGLAWLAYQSVAEGERHAQAQAQFRAANGWSQAETAVELIRGFDHNGDHAITYAGAAGALQGEAIATRDRRTSTSLTSWGLPGAAIEQTTTTRRSLEPLLTVADTDHDGVLTMTELVGYVATFDADRDGRLTTLERRAVLAHGAIDVGSDTRITGLRPPTRS